VKVGCLPSVFRFEHKVMSANQKFMVMLARKEADESDEAFVVCDSLEIAMREVDKKNNELAQAWIQKLASSPGRMRYIQCEVRSSEKKKRKLGEEEKEEEDPGLDITNPESYPPAGPVLPSNHIIKQYTVWQQLPHGGTGFCFATWHNAVEYFNVLKRATQHHTNPIPPDEILSFWKKWQGNGNVGDELYDQNCVSQCCYIRPISYLSA